MERILKEETVYIIHMARIIPLALQLTDARQIIQVYSEVQINMFAHMVNILRKWCYIVSLKCLTFLMF
jgi:hypothetical protein